MSQFLRFSLILLAGCELAAADKVVKLPVVVEPGYLESYVDPVFRSKVTRVSGVPGTAIPNLNSKWHPVARHGYSKEPAWNSDQTILLLRTHHGYPALLFLDGKTYQPLFGRNNSPGTELRWRPNAPDEMLYVKGNKIGSWNVRTETIKIIATLPGYSNFHFGPWEGNLSNNGELIAISAIRNSEAVGFAFSLVTKQKFPDLALGKVTDWISVSASGKYLVTNGRYESGQADQTKIYDLKGNPVGETWKQFGRPSHFDLTLDADGKDIAVGVSKSKPDSGRVIKRRLSDGFVTVLTSGGFATHTSTRNVDLPGWAFVTYSDTGSNWPPYRSEIVAVKLDGGMKTKRIAHLHNKQVDYLSQAQAVPSPDGRKVIWASNWGRKEGRPISAFVAEFDVNQ